MWNSNASPQPPVASNSYPVPHRPEYIRGRSVRQKRTCGTCFRKRRSRMLGQLTPWLSPSCRMKACTCATSATIRMQRPPVSPALCRSASAQLLPLLRRRDRNQATLRQRKKPPPLQRSSLLFPRLLRHWCWWRALLERTDRCSCWCSCGVSLSGMSLSLLATKPRYVRNAEGGLLYLASAQIVRSIPLFWRRCKLFPVRGINSCTQRCPLLA